MDIAVKFLNTVQNKRNCLLTGQAGTGKSYLVNLIRKEINIRRKLGNPRIAFTGSTGIAAMLIEGETIHSLSGLMAYKEFDDVIDDIRFERVAEGLKSLDIIVIDEISMLSGDTFDLFNKICQHARDNNHPFGGIQIILVGDFMQLPPVEKEDEPLKCKWVFDSEAFKSGQFEIFNLLEIKRQSDINFINLLNKVRTGLIDVDLSNMIRETSAHEFPENVIPMKLLATNKKVDAWNDYELDKVEGELFTNSASVKCRNKTIRKYLVDGLLTPYELKLKIGCQVMITCNGIQYYGEDSLEKPPGTIISYCNGSMGILKEIITVWDIDHNRKYPIKEQVTAMRMSNQCEVLVIELFNGKTVYLGPRDFTYKTKNKNLKYISEEYREKYNYTDEDFLEFDGRFTQYPVRLAYAVTVHKSQGMTLDYCEIDCRGFFAEAQLYVALSRAKSLEGLRVKNFLEKHLIVSQEALQFYKGLNDGRD